EAQAPDDPVGQADPGEHLLERPGLERSPNEDGGLGEAAAIDAAGAAPLPGFDLVADPAGLLLVVPQARDAHELARLVLRPERLAVAGLVLRDQAGGGAQDVAGRAVVALETDDAGAREILLETENVADLGAAPAIDRLVVVAH